MSWNPPFSAPVYVTLAAVIVLGIVIAYRTAISRTARRWLYLIPRALTLALLLFVLFNPVSERTQLLPTRPPRVLCLLDTSRSMGLERPETRLAVAKWQLQSIQTELESSQDAELQLFQFGEGLRSIPSLEAVRAEQDASQLFESLRQTAHTVSSEPPQALVVFSDGTVPDRQQLPEVAAMFQLAGVPIHVVPCGGQSFRGDVAIAGLTVPRGAKSGDEVPVGVQLRSYGYDGQRVMLAIRPDNLPNSRPLVQLPVTLDGTTQSFELVVPADPQMGTLRLQVDLLVDEAIADNNQVPFQLLAAPRNLRVFYMEGTTHGREWSWVRDALQEDPRIECITATLDNQYIERPRIMRIDDPYRGFPVSRQELFEFDAVICSDISRGAFTREQLDWTVELVSDRGGGFVMVGGHTAFGAGSWDQTRWDQLIPIDMSGGLVGSGFVNQAFQVVVPPEARQHPIWKLLDEPTANAQALASIPTFYGTNIARRVKPAATLLGTADRTLSVAGNAPIFASQSYGRGRTFAMMTDTTESWGSEFEKHWGENDNRYFRKFWRNVVYWLTENSLAGRQRVVAESDKQIYRAGEPIQIQAKTYDAAFAPTSGYRIEAELLDSPLPDNQQTWLEIAGAMYQGSIRATLPRPATDDEISTLAKATVVVRAFDGSELVGEDSLQVQVLNDSDELLDARPNHDCLVSLAEATGGQVFRDSRQAIAALRDLPKPPREQVVHRMPRWDRPWLWCTLLGLLTVEWILRRRMPG
jgi:uncharacterized membrane protein